MFPIFVNFKEGATLTYGMRFLFPGYCDSVRTLRQAPLSCDLDLGSISAALCDFQEVVPSPASF